MAMSLSFSPPSSAVSTPKNPNQADFPEISFSSRSQTPVSSSVAGPSNWRPPPHWIFHNANARPANSTTIKSTLREKRRTQEEREIQAETSARVASRIAADHAAVLNPDVEMPFSDIVDAVNRLLPYHVFMQPKEDLVIHNRKGKQKAVDSEEIKETKFSLECHRRRKGLQERFWKARIKSGHGSEFNPEVVVLAQNVLESERAEIATLNAQLRAARSEYDQLERQKRTSSNPSQTQSVVNGQAAYYRPYSYAYTPSYSIPATPVQIPPAAPSAPQHASIASNPPNPPTTSMAYQASTAIPVQLPIALMPSLKSLGIVPVPVGSLAEGQPLPPAVLRGSSSDGTILNLEIVVSMLQPSQVSGLAVILNSLMARSSAFTSAPSSEDKVN